MQAIVRSTTGIVAAHLWPERGKQKTPAQSRGPCSAGSENYGWLRASMMACAEATSSSA